MKQVIYAVFADKDDMKDFDPTDLEEALYFSNLTYDERPSEEQNRKNLNRFHDRFREAGFCTRLGAVDDDYGVFIPFTQPETRDKAVQALLTDSLDKLKTFVASLTPAQFAQTYAPGSINSCMNRCGDYIWLDLGTGGKLYTLEDGARRIEAQQEYYVAKQTVAVDS